MRRQVWTHSVRGTAGLQGRVGALDLRSTIFSNRSATTAAPVPVRWCRRLAGAAAFGAQPSAGWRCAQTRSMWISNDATTKTAQSTTDANIDATAGNSAEGLPTPEPHFVASRRNKQLSRWLFGCCGIVATVVVVGGITRLTESGLSIVEWKPISGVIPPLNEAQWQAEYERYKQFPEFQQKSSMTLEEFKFIFFWEWFHRALARSIGVVYGVPLLYFTARGVFRGHGGFAGHLYGCLALGGAQGALGWYMVKSGLDKKMLDDGKQKATVSSYRLAAHLSLAFAIYVGLLHAAISLRVPSAGVTCAGFAHNGRRLKRAARATLGVMFVTAVSGAFVAGLDAGLLYNDTFPYMGVSWVPPIEDLTVLSPLWRNPFENGMAAQLWHRIMAGSTVGCVALLNVIASCDLVPRNSAAAAATTSGASCGGSGPLVAAHAQRVATALRLVNYSVLTQATLGLVTLLTYVDVPTAAAHQAGSVVLLSSLVHLVAVLTCRGRVL